MWQCIFSFLIFNFLETSVFDFCYEPDSKAEANSALPSNLLVCSFSSVTPSIAQKSISGSEISRKCMLKWIALNFVRSYINAVCYIQICAIYINLTKYGIQTLGIPFVSGTWIHCKMFWLIQRPIFFFSLLCE